MNQNNLIIIGLLVVVLAVSGYTILSKNPDATNTQNTEVPTGTDAMQGKIDDNINNSGTPNETSMVAMPEGATRYEIASGSVSYTVMKRLFTKPNEEVTGTSKEINGVGWFHPETGAAHLDVNLNMATVKTSDAKRDEHVFNMFGEATDISFMADMTNPDIKIGEEFTAEVPGSLSIYGNTKDVTFTVKGVVTEDSLTAEGTSEGHKISDWGLTPPSLINMFTVDDAIDFKFNITGKRVE